MSREHLTPDGWKPCTASVKDCKYDSQRVVDGAGFIDAAVLDVESGKPNAVRSFFNALFGGKAVAGSVASVSASNPPVPASPTLELPVVPVTASTASESVLDVVSLGADGRFQVSCETFQGRENIVYVHKFGDFVKDEVNAVRLHEADVSKNYQLGECGVLAGELWNLNSHVREYYIMKTDDDQDFGIHHFVQLNDGSYADSLGVWSEESFLSYWRDVDPSARIGRFEMEVQPESRNLEFPISSPKLFNVINEIINKHMNGESI